MGFTGPLPPPRRTRGQATMEYVVVVFLIALVLAIGGLVLAAPGVANTVVASMRRALCVVAGGGCVTIAPRPCTVSSEAKDERVTVYAGIVRLGDHAGLLREVLSDGTVRITQIDDVDAALTTGAGAEVGLHVAGISLGAGAMAGAAAGVGLGTRRSWLLPDAKAADRLVALLRGPTGVKVVDDPVEAVAGFLGLGDDEDRPPPADTVTFSAGAKGLADLHAGGGIVDGDLSLVGALSAGGVWNRRTGERTVLLQGDGKITLELSRAVFRGRLRTLDRVGMALVLARDGTPRELVVSAAGQVDYGKLGSLKVSAVTTHRREGLRGEVDVRVDLTERADMDVARRALAAIATGRPLLDPAAVSQTLVPLVRLLEEDGRVDLRTYEGASLAGGLGGSLAAGGRVGGEVEVSQETLRLLDAWSRPPGGVWEERVDCTGDDR